MKEWKNVSVVFDHSVEHSDHTEHPRSSLANRSERFTKKVQNGTAFRGKALLLAMVEVCRHSLFLFTLGVTNVAENQQYCYIVAPWRARRVRFLWERRSASCEHSLVGLSSVFCLSFFFRHSSPIVLLICLALIQIALPHEIKTSGVLTWVGMAGEENTTFQ